MRSMTTGHVTSSRHVLCCSNSECRMIFERDVNAARKIWTVETWLIAGRGRLSWHASCVRVCVDSGGDKREWRADSSTRRTTLIALTYEEIQVITNLVKT
ncbi:hypothetical protein PybrP1_007439 [[Pythium] brassicae (nom. inval.)]|nr:hypothetical protein PybrP1_007439 [[Pythium] brassicae (nom. inval.)]